MIRLAVVCAAVLLLVAFPGPGGVAEVGREAANVLVLVFVYLGARWCGRRVGRG